MQGAVVFATVPTCLTWRGIESVHWSAPAFWYASIVFAVTSVVIAAQQTMVLSGLQKAKYTFVRERVSQTLESSPETCNAIHLAGPAAVPQLFNCLIPSRLILVYLQSAYGRTYLGWQSSGTEKEEHWQ